MIKVAITGNIASGKSQVEKYLIGLGFKVIDADKVNHSILKEDASAINEIKSLFDGFDILDEEGEISRSKLGRIVFNDKTLLRGLEKILHKRIDKNIDDFISQNGSEKVIFVSMPLLFETGQESKFDKIIFISTDEDIRLKRICARNGFSEEHAKKIIDSQTGEKEKIKKSDFVIFNNSDFINLENQLKILVNSNFL